VTREEVFALVSDDLKERVIGVENPTFEVPDEDPDDVLVDQPADLRVSFLELAV